MTPVQVDWLSILFGPIVVVALALAFFARRSTAKSGEPMPDWRKAAQGVGVALALFVAFINVVWGGQ